MRKHYLDLIPIVLVLSKQVLRRRLLLRARERVHEVGITLKRNELLSSAAWFDDELIVCLVSSAELSITLEPVLEILRQCRVSAASNRA